MSSQLPVNLPVRANADLSAKQYFCVKVVAANEGAPTVDLTSNITDIVYGVLQDKPNAAGQHGTVAVGGVTLAVASAAIALNAKVAPTAVGKIQLAVSTQNPIGIALKAATADGDIIPIRLEPTLTPLP